MTDLTDAYFMGMAVAAKHAGIDIRSVKLDTTLDVLRSVSQGDEVLANIDDFPKEPELRKEQSETEKAMATKLLQDFGVE